MSERDEIRKVTASEETQPDEETPTDGDFPIESDDRYWRPVIWGWLS